MNGLATFLEMGGYAGFVWPAYALTIAVLVVLGVVSFQTTRKRAAELEILQAASPHRKRRAASPTFPDENADGL